jgi:hypothetical protein
METAAPSKRRFASTALHGIALIKIVLTHHRFYLLLFFINFLLGLPFIQKIKVVSSSKSWCTSIRINGIPYQADLHLISVRLTAFKEGAYFTGIRIFNHVPANVKELANKIELFKSVLKRYLLLQSCYSLDEYFNYSGQ